MKEIPFKSNDINTIKEIADEINNIQGITHENLVKFYGCELHRVKQIDLFLNNYHNNSELNFQLYLFILFILIERNINIYGVLWRSINFRSS
jgi:hypothetical protein